MPELYIEGLQELNQGAIATRYNADGTISKVLNKYGAEVDAVYKLKDIKVNDIKVGQEWSLIQ